MKTSRILMMVMVTVFFIASFGAPTLTLGIEPEKQYKEKKGTTKTPKKTYKKKKAKPGFSTRSTCPQLKITSPDSLIDGRQGQPYNCMLQTSGGQAPITFAKTSGSLPPGMSLSPAGLIFGVPSTAGTYSITITATDSCQPTQSVEKSFTLAIRCDAFYLGTFYRLPEGILNAPYSKQLERSGGQEPITWTKVSGSLPPGLTLSPSGLISGKPSRFGTYEFTLRATDSCPSGAQTNQMLHSLSIRMKEGERSYVKPMEERLKLKSEMQEVHPRIESAFRVPLGPLKPGTKLYLKGKYFGTQPGRIVIHGNFPTGPITLVNTEWVSDMEVNGVVPMYANGYANQTVEVRVHIRQDTIISNPITMGFEGREEKVLTRHDVGVVCGSDDTLDFCNVGAPDCPDDMSMCGFHKRLADRIGAGVGDDKYFFFLKNGWTFKSMEIVKWRETSGDEEISGPSPTVPVGQSSWSPVIHWEVSPADKVHYQIRIIVDGPLGTHYK